MNIKLIKIDKDDIELLRNWRMQENVTKYMLTDPIITKESQLEWFNKINNDESRIDYVIVCDDVKIGYYGITNIDYEKSSCEIGFYIGDNKYRGKGLFRFIHEYAENIIFNKLNLKSITVNVLENNPIIKTYYELGFKDTNVPKNNIFKNGESFVIINLNKQANKQTNKQANKHNSY